MPIPDILNPMTYNYSFTPEIVRHLQTIERARAEVILTVLPPARPVNTDYRRNIGGLSAK